MARLTVKSSKKPAVTITREAVKSKKLVYIAVANKPVSYPHQRSKIVYIGTTQRGAHRMAASAAKAAEEMLALHGIKSLEFFPITCRPRQKVETWKKLESGLLLSFKQIYGAVPKCNTQGKRQAWRDELKYFSRLRLESILALYSV